MYKGIDRKHTHHSNASKKIHTHAHTQKKAADYLRKRRYKRTTGIQYCSHVADKNMIKVQSE